MVYVDITRAHISCDLCHCCLYNASNLAIISSFDTCFQHKTPPTRTAILLNDRPTSRRFTFRSLSNSPNWTKEAFISASQLHDIILHFTAQNCITVYASSKSKLLFSFNVLLFYFLSVYIQGETEKVSARPSFFFLFNFCVLIFRYILGSDQIGKFSATDQIDIHFPTKI